MGYNVLLSLGYLLKHTLDRDHRYLILDEKQQLEALLEKVSILLDFLDNSSQKSIEAIENLGRQITDAAYKAEDIIESNIARRIIEESRIHEDRYHKEKKNCFCLSIIRKSSSDTGFQEISLSTFCLELEKVAEEFDTIKKKVEKIEDESDVKDQHLRTWSCVSPSEPASNFKSNMIGLDDDMMEIKEQLTGRSSNLETVSIVGMGGIGKTCLAKTVYDDPLIAYHFHIRAWVTVSQDYTVQDILLGLLDSMRKFDVQIRGKETEQPLEELLYKNLKGRRYLIVMDDIWDAKVWNHVRQCFPNDKNGSRILITSRLDNVAGCGNPCFPHRKRFLNIDESWNLFCKNVFGKDCCPLELEQVGKKIVENCQGLPLAIIVIAGLLSKATRTHSYWENVGENLSSIIALTDDKFFEILSLSYKGLPHHLKECFLYMGVFPEDSEISVSKLVKLWVAEGFIKSSKDKSLEDRAEEYLLELVDRNLVLVSQRSSQGKFKTCKIHDLLRDLCVKEAQREKLFHVDNGNLHNVISLRRLGIPRGGQSYYCTTQEKRLLLRTILHFDTNVPLVNVQNCKLIRVLEGHDIVRYEDHHLYSCPTTLAEAVNLKFLACCFNDDRVPAYVYKLRNLQTLIIHSQRKRRCDKIVYLERKFWRMTQLRHVQNRRIILPDPPSSENEAENPVTVLQNLQLLSTVINFRSTKEILKRIPNLRKLGIQYKDGPMDWRYYCLENLVHLDKLESLKCYSFFGLSPASSFLHDIIFPPSLKKLTLHGRGFGIPWEHMSIIGSLPNLLVLKLRLFAFCGPVWEPNEGEFLRLKYLLLDQIKLVHWEADSIHFPSLKHLVLKSCYGMVEIPCGIGEIPTLQMIEVHYCEDEIVTSAEQILEEQRSFGNDVLRVLIQRNSKHVSGIL